MVVIFMTTYKRFVGGIKRKQDESFENTLPHPSGLMVPYLLLEMLGIYSLNIKRDLRDCRVGQERNIKIQKSRVLALAASSFYSAFARFALVTSSSIPTRQHGEPIRFEFVEALWSNKSVKNEAMMFKNQLGRNMEVYVDDMLVKSKTSREHSTNLKEAFSIFQSYGMKLNPKKCTFCFSSWKFFGIIISSRGMEANSENIKASIDMQSPKNHKDVQSVMGRIAALSRLILKSIEKCILFLNVL
uniref:Reverse transcriptase domain-containing protein n=1 Tax=Cannabis sativa TaxID=3483 RepID=A0A803PDE0_CANSA